MFLGYNEECEGWKEDKKISLLEEIQEQTKFSYFGRIDVREIGKGPLGDKPYLQLDSFGKSGVYIRKVTNMTQDERLDLNKICDGIYDKIMEVNDVEQN